MAFNWMCPFCEERQTVTAENFSCPQSYLDLGSSLKDGYLGVRTEAVVCLNPKCGKTSVDVIIGKAEFRHGQFASVDTSAPVMAMQLIPFGNARQRSPSIPLAIYEDYREACLILELSPKAAATLVRRCLQGMIRDFAGISKATLFQEITALREAVDDGSADRSITPETVEAINHVRGIGNIGAHMEKDIDHIVPVDPGEAQALIDLVEMLFEEWYEARETRRAKLARIENVALEKLAVKTSASESKPDA